MTMPNLKHLWTKAAGAALIGFAIVATSGSAVRANDEDDDVPMDTKIIRGFLTGLGLKRDGSGGIEYRERSPLVVPPAINLPSPESKSAAERTPAWPNDPDVKRAKEAKANARKPRKSIEEESMPSLPYEQGQRRASAPAGQRPTGEAGKEPTAPSSMWDLNAKSFFNWDGLMGTYSKKEQATFTQEPARSSLHEPPPGYRTPAPNFPYGVGTGKAEAVNPMDTTALRGTGQ